MTGKICAAERRSRGDQGAAATNGRDEHPAVAASCAAAQRAPITSDGGDPSRLPYLTLGGLVESPPWSVLRLRWRRDERAREPALINAAARLFLRADKSTDVQELPLSLPGPPPVEAPGRPWVDKAMSAHRWARL